MSAAYFIYNNLKVNTLLPGDSPFPGFELLTFDNESWTFGTLWNLGWDAGYSYLGKHQVKGQVWYVQNKDSISELEKYAGVKSGLMEPINVEVKIEALDGTIQDTVQAVTFRLKELKPEYKIVDSGFWWINPQQKQ